MILVMNVRYMYLIGFCSFPVYNSPVQAIIMCITYNTTFNQTLS